MSATLLNRPPAHRSQRRRSIAQRGFALIAAIFLLVVLAALGAFMVSLSTVQHITSAQDLQGSRAYQAARAGIEWGVYQAMKPEHSNLPAGQTPYNCPASTTSLNNLAGASTGFSVQVQCASTTNTEGPNQIVVFQFTSTASSGSAGSAQYVARQLSASISTCRTSGTPCTE